ncbi:uncharacterized protein THITE_2107989 [Thermothielavioides terrestris NRRL 8126]|uniref:Thioredoxin-like fold domain-containing protein n=1 Tax=Thermothielavioides terrestris (strain ATCC 38088 / NRRL 8126) TaxID=578455 RepID=G2QWV0_THETT|nr:uncharacterized protein THITE_2107989 [Thermothielavioides terrestris NRRL 8126]AEO63114.1 hypothetical protein THITE_2107989 [Thermothielavioides terrestris NRRL 8126]
MAAPTQPTITLYRGFAIRGAHVPSPFVNKLEARLRIGGLTYRVETGSPLHAPRGKLPYIELSSAPAAGDGEKLGDSALIARRLVEDGHMADLNAGLTPVERARDLAVRALLEDRLYFFQCRERWIDNYYVMRDTVLAQIPYPIRIFVGLLAYRNQKNVLHGQGVLRFTDEEAAAQRHEAWESVNAMLVDSRSKAQAAGRDGPFWVLGGANPTEADPVVFGFIAGALSCKMAPDTEKIIRGMPAVMEYARRIHDRYFSDYQRWHD